MTERLIAAWDTRPEDKNEGNDLPAAASSMDAYNWMRQAFPHEELYRFVYRVEFLDTPEGYQARVFRYAANEEGSRYAVEGVAATMEPVTFFIVGLPPAKLIGGKQ